MSFYHFCKYHGFCERDAVNLARLLREHMTGDIEQWLNDPEFFSDLYFEILEAHPSNPLLTKALDLIYVSVLQPPAIRRLQYMQSDG